MWPDLVVVAALAFEHDPRLFERIKNLPVEQFVAELGVEAFAIAILPRAAGRDIGGLRAVGRHAFAMDA